MENLQIRRLNSLRAIAALIVAVSHYSNMSGIWGALLGKGAGQFGVMLFFILSGFLMSHLYLGRDFRWRAVRGYAVARLARVWPLFAVVLITSYVAQRVGSNEVAYGILGWRGLTSHLLLLKGTSILWTIPVEVQFYLAFILLWLLAAKLGRAWIAVCAACIVAPGLMHYPELDGRLWGGVEYEFYLATSLPYFAVGVLFGQLYGSRWCARLPRSPWFALAMLGIPLMYPPIYMGVFGLEHAMWEDPLVLAVLASVLFVYIFMVPDCPVVANRVGDFLGKISYSIYLLHLPLVIFMQPMVQSGENSILLLMGVFLLATVGISALSYHLIEAPSRRLIRTRLWAHE
ncbi:MAG: peptidoglycan/LPS O-acetylase OafA/YrhL [Chlamydiales bacterium]|jgi:peptidoglycan/LPS O-acetylase OafA/YrhL